MGSSLSNNKLPTSDTISINTPQHGYIPIPETDPRLPSIRKPLDVDSSNEIGKRYKYYSKLNVISSDDIHEFILPYFITYSEPLEEGGSFLFIPSGSTGSSSFLSSVFNLSNTILGGGILALPYAFASAGLVSGLILTVLVVVLCGFSANLLIICGAFCSGPSFKNIAVASFGKFGAKFTEVVLILLTFGILCGYVVVVKDVLPLLVDWIAYSATGDFVVNKYGWASDPLYMTALFSVLIFLPVSCLKKLNSLRFTSITALVSIAFVSSVVISKGIIHAVNGKVEIEYFVWKVSLLQAFPILCLAFVYHFNIAPIYAELKNPTDYRIQWVCNLASSAAAVIYCATATFGYLKGGSHTTSNVLTSYGSKDDVAGVAYFAMLLVIIGAFPLLCYPCRINVRTLLFKGSTSNFVHFGVTIVLVGRLGALLLLSFTRNIQKMVTKRVGFG